MCEACVEIPTRHSELATWGLKEHYHIHSSFFPGYSVCATQELWNPLSSAIILTRFPTDSRWLLCTIGGLWQAFGTHKANHCQFMDQSMPNGSGDVSTRSAEGLWLGFSACNGESLWSKAITWMENAIVFWHLLVGIWHLVGMYFLTFTVWSGVCVPVFPPVLLKHKLLLL